MGDSLISQLCAALTPGMVGPLLFFVLASAHGLRPTPYPMHLLPCDSWDGQTFIPSRLNASADPERPAFFNQSSGVDLRLQIHRRTTQTEPINLAINITGDSGQLALYKYDLCALAPNQCTSAAHDNFTVEIAAVVPPKP